MNNKYDMEKIHLQKPDKLFVEKLVDDFMIIWYYKIISQLQKNK